MFGVELIYFHVLRLFERYENCKKKEKEKKDSKEEFES